MSDIRTQLREYGRQLDEMAPHPSPADVIASSAAAETAPRFRPRPAWAFGGAFILTLAIVGAVWLLRIDDAADDVVEEPESGIDFESLEWTRTPISEVFGAGAEITAVTLGGPGFVAVGSLGESAAVWTSPDAFTWTRVPHDRGVFGGSAIIDVTTGVRGLIAVGRLESAPAVWTSPDGFSWSRAAIIEGPRGTDVWAVTTGGPGFVAVGSEDVDIEGAWDYSTVGRVWTSPDGYTWTQVPHDPEIFGHAGGHETSSSIDQVVAGGPGLVAIGVLDGDAAVWTSEDGLVWAAATEGLTWTSTVIDGGRMSDVTPGGSGLVAVGGYELDPTCKANTPGDCYAAVWTSADGITWDSVAHDEAVFGGGPDKQGMSSVASIGTDLVAAGSSVWTSEDGTNWTRIYRDPDFHPGEHAGMRYLFAGRETLIAFGEAAIPGVPVDLATDDYVYVATEPAAE